MQNQALPSSVETFRLRGAILVQGIVFTTMFLALSIACVSVAFMEDPARYGFKGEHAVPFMFGVGVFFWGGWTILGLYTVAASFIERVTVGTTSIVVRSVFQNRRFDAADVEVLKWKLGPAGGRIEFHVGNKRTKLDLAGYKPSDRLALIRRFRALILVERQADWPMFCHRIALPLRDECSSRMYEPAQLEARGEVFITRQRYDRVARWAIPGALAIALVIWWATASKSGFAVVVPVLFWWLFIRYTVPRQGIPQPRLLTMPGGTAILLWMLTVVLAGVVASGVRLAGYSRDAGCWGGLLILGPTFPFYLYNLYRADKQRKREDETAAQLAPLRWDEGEADDASFPSNKCFEPFSG